jgi:hypothetical protein
MSLSNFDETWNKRQRIKPNIRILAVRRPNSLDMEAVAWILVERQEVRRLDERDGTVYEASIRLAYRQLAARHAYPESAKGEFCASYHKAWNTLSLTSTSLTAGAIFPRSAQPSG